MVQPWETYGHSEPTSESLSSYPQIQTGIGRAHSAKTDVASRFNAYRFLEAKQSSLAAQRPTNVISPAAMKRIGSRPIRRQSIQA